MSVRTCPQCGKPLERRGTERADNFTRRRFCNATCSSAHRRTLARTEHAPEQAAVVDEDWWPHAACRGTNTDLFFHPDQERGDLRTFREAQALAVCAVCPVRSECLRSALARDERYGVWGGTTESQRAAMRLRGVPA